VLLFSGELSEEFVVDSKEDSVEVSPAFSPQLTAAKANAQERESKNAVKDFFIITPLKNINYQRASIVCKREKYSIIPH
jgi:hypothetical protein